MEKLKNQVRNEIFRQMSLTLTYPLDVPVRPIDAKGLITVTAKLTVEFRFSVFASFSLVGDSTLFPILNISEVMDFEDAKIRSFAEGVVAILASFSEPYSPLFLLLDLWIKKDYR